LFYFIEFLVNGQRDLPPVVFAKSIPPFETDPPQTSVLIFS
jgi:hypothetical protein